MLSRDELLGKRNKNKKEKDKPRGLIPRENGKIEEEGENNNFRHSNTSIKRRVNQSCKNNKQQQKSN